MNNHEDLNRHYNESHRHYHNLNHIHECFDALDRVERLLSPSEFSAGDYEEIVCMIWFHDIIYNVGADVGHGDNERDSANVWLESEQAALLPYWVVNIVKNGILMSAAHTKTHKNITKSQEIFLDIDLSGLGSSYEEFLKNGENIRKEYEWVPLVDFLQARVNFFQTLVFRDFIYYNHVMRGLYEEKARANINQWIHENA
jgi:predicted metal-dependent HD superfamily phosphohydrolase